MAKKNVVVIKDTLGKTCYVAFPKLLDENEINKELNKASDYWQRKEFELQVLKNRVSSLESKVNDLVNEIKHLKGED